MESSSSFKVIGTSPQSAGSVVTISANIGHSMGNVLTITAMLLNGQKVCGAYWGKRRRSIVKLIKIKL